MKGLKLIQYFIILLAVSACETESKSAMNLTSPNGELKLEFNLDENGAPNYSIIYKDQTLIDKSYMGFSFKGRPDLGNELMVQGTSSVSEDEIWEMPWGEQLEVRNRYNHLKIELIEHAEPKRQFNIIFRLYDDGFGFQYEFPEQPNWAEAYILEEHTEFNLTEDYKTFWIPGDWDIYEHLYSTTKFSEIDALSKRDHPNLAQSYIPLNAVNTPVTMVGANGLHLSFHEAALVDFSGMTLAVDNENLRMKSVLVGSENRDYKVYKELPFRTPWRTVQVSEDAAGLIDSKLIVNLNEPNKIGDVSWFKPMKYTGVWWEMHLGKSSWDYGMVNENGKWVDKGQAHGRHGATTENVKRFIDFSAKNNIGGVLVEGWNTGWERWIGFEDREGVFDFLTPYPDYNIEEVSRYAREKGVQIIMHHETSAATETYSKQQDSAFALMKSMGMNVVKTGYVGKILPRGEYHHGQYMVNHYNNTVEKAAQYQVAINAHEPIKATGLRRTFPNTISREGLRGQEFNAWSIEGGNPPEHLTIVAFTRMLAGPVDFTPGIFNIKFDEYKDENQVNTTLAKQLALYVVIYSPVQMAADLVEHYEARPNALQFIRDVGVDWQQSLVLNGEVGDYVTIARQERGSGNWFVGGITDENARQLTIKFDFLNPDKSYSARLYSDAKDAHWKTNPTALEIEKLQIGSGDEMTIDLVEGGGFAMSIMEEK